MKKHINISNILTLVGTIAGFFYWNLYSCDQGCAITGTWYGSVLIGGVFGNLIGGMIADFKKSKVE